MNSKEIIKLLKQKAKPDGLAKLAHYGIKAENAFGVRMPEIRAIGKMAGKNHKLAQECWNTEIHDVRMVAILIEDPKTVTEEQLDQWVNDLYSWDLCDHFCGDLVRKSPFGWKKAFEWSSREEEFVKRAGFALMAWLGVHDKKAPNEKFEEFLPVIIRESEDPRNFVHKAVDWALRQIGKRNVYLNRKAIETCHLLIEHGNRVAVRTGKVSLKELESEKIQVRVRKLSE